MARATPPKKSTGARPAAKPAKKAPSHPPAAPARGSKPAAPSKTPSGKPVPAKPAGTAKKPANGGQGTAVLSIPRGDGRQHVLSLSFVRDGDEFLARLETDAGQITELKNRSLDQLLTLVAGELEDLLE